MIKSQEELIREEQKILNDLIHDMDRELLSLDKRLEYNALQAKKAKEKCLPDTYGALVSAEQNKVDIRKQKKELYQVRNELYETRLIVEYSDESDSGKEEIKIGLHTYLRGKRVFIMSWKMPICRHYILDNSAEEFDNVVTSKYGEKYYTHYQLKLKRQIDMVFDKINSVTHLFPVLNEEIEQIVADEFLQELLSRRSGQEFKNIVFSIQKKQGQIIQTAFEQNLIVQGCAGSGKSMIMLHRLPIIIYDNPNSLDRNNLYIITPSVAYIQMANNMRIDLEIEDLKIGTLEQYYDYQIEKYGRKAEEYGELRPYIKLDEEQQKYIYSKQCILDIKKKLLTAVKQGEIDCSLGYSILELTNEFRSGKTIAEEIRLRLLQIQKLLNKNNQVLQGYYRGIYDVIEKIDELSRRLETRKIVILRVLNRMISEENDAIKSTGEKLKKINEEANEVKYKNHVAIIRSAQKRILDLEETKEIVKLDDEYFILLNREAKKLRKVILLFREIKNEREKINFKNQYKMIENKNELCEYCFQFLKDLEEIGDPYWEYIEGFKRLSEEVLQSVERLSNICLKYLPLEYLEKLNQAISYYTSIETNLVKDTYLTFMKQLGQEPDSNNKLIALSCSPYLYLQILYAFYGMPNASKESLITIDEAQNIASEELVLIKAINGNKVIFNLFGDVNQHVEGSKGIDSWKDIVHVSDFEIQNMQENYRNARQITEYCNNKFGLRMRAINLDGSGVHEFSNQTEFESNLLHIFQKPKNIGLSCIVVKNKEEAAVIYELLGILVNKVHDMTEGMREIHRNKWNLMLVEQVKGLEFETVFAITGRMSKNEKYITYTRALDELYVYDVEIPLLLKISKVEVKKDIENPIIKNTRKKREKRKVSGQNVEYLEPAIELKTFFANAGLKVIDARKKTGFLWVLGEREVIDSVVKEATEKYKISGEYSSGKILGFQQGWFTKSKK